MSEGDLHAQIAKLRDRLSALTAADRQVFRRRLAGLANRPSDRALQSITRDLDAALARHQARLALAPTIAWPDLPVTHCLDRLRDAISSHQVVIVAGETGSGKTTQLPKLCVSMGRGRDGLIGHTQPRRLAARTVASRVAEELGSQTGALVGCKVRFHDQVSDLSLVKVMTDGILLAEIQYDPRLDQYDTLIIDEAHERSLNIDFLLGFLHRLLPRRPDLRLIITSATIDHERFARHFNNAPVVEIPGRSYPVDIQYRPQGDTGEQDTAKAVTDILHEIEASERQTLPAARDVLVFLCGEREIRDLNGHLRRSELRNTEVLPLYSRLSHTEQMRIFAPHRGRRVVLATNVAETSLTVPGIRYVIDAGTARISRYSVHSKVQRLPIEPISQASANQRAGRAGRLCPGVCFRLYSEDDYLSRASFTDPEIHRTNLASVILRMADLRLGEVDDFPFMEPPQSRQIRDGYRLLEELGAMQGRRLTSLGKQLARLPIDPRLGRMVLAAGKHHALREVLIIVSALAVQDPRERPPEHRQQADQAHQAFADTRSDFLFFVNLWQWAEDTREALSRNLWEKQLRQHFISPLRMREWRDVHHQLLLCCRELGLHFSDTAAQPDTIHRALLSGLLSHVACRNDKNEWVSTRNRKPIIWPGSVMAKTKARWIMAAELVETTRLFARCVASIDPDWIEKDAAHLVQRQYSEPHWSVRQGAAMAMEKVSLFGLPLVTGRRVHYAPIDASLSRELLIREGLVAGALRQEPPFVRANRETIERLEAIEHKLRRKDILADEETRFQFYDSVIPQDMVSLRQLQDWYKNKATDAQRRTLLMTDTLLLPQAPDVEKNNFPDHLNHNDLRLPLEYSFDPAGDADGITLITPVQVLNQITADRLTWLVPGLLRQKLEALLRALPRHKRRQFVPIPDYVQALMESLDHTEEPLLTSMTRELQRMAGIRIEPDEWPETAIPDHLRMNIRVMDNDSILAESRDLAALQERFAHRAARMIESQDTEERKKGRNWVFGELPQAREISHGSVSVRAWVALRDQGNEVQEVLCDTKAEADWLHCRGVARLLLLRLADQTRQLQHEVLGLPGFQKAAASKLAGGKSLPADALLACALHLFPASNNIRDDSGFRQCLDDGRATFLTNAQALLQTWNRHLATAADLKRRLSKDFPLAWAHAHRDISQQIDDLIYPGFLSDTSGEWLAQYGRYLTAIAHRLDKLGGQLASDKEKTRELEALRNQYQTRVGKNPIWEISPDLQQWRWMLEEYRVSLFSQHLGTRLPVSAKRLRKQWESAD